VDSEKQTLLMIDVVNSRETIITQAFIVGFQLLDKPLQRSFQLRMSNLFTFTGNKNDAKLHGLLTNARKNMGHCLTCLYSK